MPRTRQQRNSPEEEESIGVTVTDSESTENSAVQLNFMEMMQKMDQVLGKLTNISDDVGKIFTLIFTQVNLPQTNSVDRTTERTTEPVNNENSTTTTQQLCDNIRELILETNQPAREREAKLIKRNMENIWYRKLNDRRKQFWQKLRNENQAKIYESWRNQTPIIIPQQLQMHNVNGEPDDQRRRRERQVLDNFKTEKDLLELRAQSHEEKYKKTDDEMIAIISEKANGRCREILTTLWYEETKREEDVSTKRWKTQNEIWLKKYETEFATKYAEKNPFIKEQGDYEETPRIRGQNRFSQPRTRSSSPNNQRRVRNDTQTNNRQNNEDRPLYSNVVQRNRQQRGAMGRSRQPGPPRSMESRRPQGENQDYENNTTFIGQRFQQRNRSPDLPPFYRSRFRANPSPREERHDQQNSYRYRSGQNRNRQRDEQSYNRLSNQDQNHFLEQDDQITQET